MLISCKNWIPRFAEALNRLAETHSMRAMREGLLWLIPCLLVSATFVMAGAVLDTLGVWPELSARLTSIHRAISNLMPLFVAASIGYMLSIRLNMTRAPVAFLCLTFSSIANTVLLQHSPAAAAFQMPVAIVIPLLALPSLRWLVAQQWTQLNRDGIAGNNVRRALELVIPGIIVGTAIAIVIKLITLTPGFAYLTLSFRLDVGGMPYFSGILYALLNSTLWFFGIHGYHALLPLIDQLDAALVVNQLAAGEGRAIPNIMNGAFLGSFVFIGGCGATFGLALAMLLRCKNRSLRVLAAASMPIGMLNVNEILLFGLPIIFNPKLLIPFLTVPVVNVALALAATQAGFVSPAIHAAPFNSPILLNAYVATGNDPHAVLLQLFCILVDMAIYMPFARQIDAQSQRLKRIHLPSLDSTYTQLQEAAEAYGYDPVVQANALRNRQASNEVHLAELASREFYLAYQPQVCRESGAVTGCEALLRCRDELGAIHGPSEFLPWLEQGRLMKQVDIWCAIAACKQYGKWRSLGLDLPITINVTADSLADRATWSAMVDHLSVAHGQVSIEITEGALVNNSQDVAQAIAAFHSIGAKVYLDDFGTGYSALNYLHSLAIDAIKIDRSFVLALDNERGRMVMKGLVDFARALDLRLIVEGVETFEQLNQIPGEYPASIQGWLYSKAIDGNDMPAFVERQRASACRAVAGNNRDTKHGDCRVPVEKLKSVRFDVASDYGRKA